MTKLQASYLPETREKSVAMVFDARRPEESLKAACVRVAPLVNVKFATLYHWCKLATPTGLVSSREAVTVGELEAENKALKRANCVLVRVNEILNAATTFFGPVSK